MKIEGSNYSGNKEGVESSTVPNANDTSKHIDKKEFGAIVDFSPNVIVSFRSHIK